MSSLVQRAAKAAKQRRKAGKPVNKIELLMRILSPIQKEFVTDKARFKIARSGRRAGKTLVDAIYAIIEALSGNGTPVLYVGLTRESAKAAIWDILITTLDTLGIAYEPTESALLIKFPNKSFIQLFGADATNARSRLRGRKFKLIIVDEMGFFADGDPLIYSLIPSLADYKGTLVMTSSPGEVLSGIFYEADQGSLKDGWSHYHWTLLDNPHFQKPSDNPKFKTNGEEELDTICRLQFKGDRNHPAFRREYLGEWITDSSARVYPHTHLNLTDSLVLVRRPLYALGVDLTNPHIAAVVVLRYSMYVRRSDFVHAELVHYTSVDSLSKRLGQIAVDFKTDLAVAHAGTGHQLISDINRRHQLGLIAADKLDKSMYQRIFASDLLSGHIQCLQPATAPLISEWSVLVKDEAGDERSGTSNILSNAALFVYRKVYQTVLSNFEEEKTEEERMIEKIEEQARAEAEALAEGYYY